MNANEDLDPTYAGDRNAGSTPPESGEAGSNVVGRPAGNPAGSHERTQTAETEREPFTDVEALKDGGSFDGLGVPVADD